MTQQSGSQFEDDLTIGMEEDESFATDSIDLLGIGGDENSPIARLKTIILSIDWEINDDILQQLDDELHDLEQIWAADKIKQVYVQGLSKIGRYIYKEKASAHPNSINLLITFYHNLEKIVINEDSMSEDAKKQLLLADVKKFDQLKSQIAAPSSPAEPIVTEESRAEADPASGYNDENSDVTELKALKAQVLGIDWEINDVELEKLDAEVKRLESVYSQSKAKLILLQGIGALSSYINKQRSQSNSGAFTLLHSFYGALENISGNNLSAADEKQLLLSEVSKFNDFKAEIAKEKESPAGVVSDVGSAIDSGEKSGKPATAVSGGPAALVEETVSEELEFSDDDTVVAADVTSRLSSVFGDEEESEKVEVDKEEALAGVDVETEADDDSDEEALPYQDGTVAPALVEVEEDSSFSVEKLADDLSVAPPTAAPEPIVGDDVEQEDTFNLEDTDDQIEEKSGEELSETDADDGLPGVDVETEADDDSDEESLPMEEGELAPALSGVDEESGFNAETMAAEFDKSDSAAIEDRLGAFFDDEVATSSEGWVSETSGQLVEPEETDVEEDVNIVAALSEVEEETIPEETLEDPEVPEPVLEETGILLEDDESSEEESPAIFEEDEPIAALSDSDEEILIEDTDEEQTAQDNAEAAVEEGLSFLDDDIDEETEEEPEEILSEDIEPVVEEEPVAIIEEDEEAIFTETEETNLEEVFEAVDEEEEPLAEDALVTEETETEETEEAQSPEEAALAFFDDADSEVEEPVQEAFNADDETDPFDFNQDEDEIAFEVESDDVTEDDEIEFTVPGEDSAPVAEDVIESENVEEIEIDIPGEVAGFGTAVAAATVAGAFMTSDNEETDITDVIEEATEEIEEEVVFEAVDDDVEIDLLPGEEFDDSVTLGDDNDSVIEESSDQLVEFTAVEDDQDTGRYESIAILVSAVQDNMDEDTIQDILTEVNKLRSSKDTSYSDKTFLQLLSSVTQFVENNNDPQGLELMQEIVVGLEMSDSSSSSEKEVQEQLFGCTSKILLLKAKAPVPVVEEDTESVVIEEDEPVEAVEKDITDSAENTEDTPNYKPMGDDEQLASFVQKELADIRKLFVEEIGSLRKELADKK